MSIPTERIAMTPTPENTPRVNAMQKWSALLIGENHGLLSSEFDDWKTHPEHYERTKLVRFKDVVELERETIQLRKELEEAQRQAALYNTDTMKVMEQRDHYHTKAEQWEKMAEALAEQLGKVQHKYRVQFAVSWDKIKDYKTPYDAALDHFQTLKQTK